jgi:hypothetical protein
VAGRYLSTAPSQPPTAKQYTKAGYPWFDYYDAEMQALEGSKTLATMKSVKEKGEEKRAQPLPENDPVSVASIVNLRADLQSDPGSRSDFCS